MSMHQRDASISRRTALAGLGAGGVGLAFAAGARPVAAQDAASEMATHPIVGAWLVAPSSERRGFETIVFTADGSVMQGFAVTLDHGPRGVWFSGPGVGAWEPTGERGAAYTAVTVLSDAAGTNLGTTTVDGTIVVSEDGRTFDDGSFETTFTHHDSSGAITSELSIGPNDPPIIATRIRVKSPGFPGT